MHRNLELIGVYRDNAVHFYNAHGFGVVIYSLAQTAIVNYRDLLQVFHQDLADEITWDLLPVGTRAPIDPLQYLGGARSGGAGGGAVDEFLATIRQAAADLEDEGIDTGRLLTVFDVSLQSVKKIEQADIVVGVSGEPGQERVLVSRVLDPNRSHPYRQKDILPLLADASGERFNPYSFCAVAWHHSLHAKQHFCWTDEATNTKKWSREAVAYFKKLTPEQIAEARTAYGKRHKRSGTGPPS